MFRANGCSGTAGSRRLRWFASDVHVLRLKVTSARLISGDDGRLTLPKSGTSRVSASQPGSGRSLGVMICKIKRFESSSEFRDEGGSELQVA